MLSYHQTQLRWAGWTGGDLQQADWASDNPGGVFISSALHLVTQESPPKRKLFAKMHVSHPIKGCWTSLKTGTHLWQVALADATVHEFSYHLRDHFIMEAVSIARFLRYVASLKRFHTQTQLAGRQSHNWATPEATHRKHNPHQFWRPEHPHRKKRFYCSKNFLGILFYMNCIVSFFF